MRYATKDDLVELFGEAKSKYGTLDPDGGLERTQGGLAADWAKVAKADLGIEGSESGQPLLIGSVDQSGKPTAYSAYTPMTQETAEIIHREMVKKTALLAAMAGKQMAEALASDWDTLATSVSDGLGNYVIPVGSSVVTKYTDSRPSVDTVYDARFNVMRHTTGTLDGGGEARVAILQMDRCLPYDTEFSPRQAFLYSIDGLPAGTYNVVVSDTTYGRAAGTYQFTLADDLPAGGQLAGFFSNGAAANVSVYTSQAATTATETCAVTAGSDGTNLGTFSAAGVSVPASGTPEIAQTVEVDGETYSFYGLNSQQRVSYGNNRWLHSPLRQFLNATGQGWWAPATVFDRPPSYVGHTGFLSGLDPDMVAAMVPAMQVTALNYVTDGGTSAEPQYDTTYDKVFLPSGKEHHIEATAYYGGAAGLEGEAWDYWVLVAGSQHPLAWSTYGKPATYHKEYRQYDLASPTTARTCWMRSANRGNGNNVTCVYSSGTCNYNGATYALRAAPACAIGSIG